MSVLDVKHFEHIEEVIGTIHKAFPHVPESGRRLLTELLPYVTFCVAVLICIINLLAMLPGTGFELTPDARIFTFNILLLRAVNFLLAYILFISFKPLSVWSKKGWYNLFYVSLIQLLLTLIFFNVYTLLAQVFVWYVLFELKKEYS